MVGGAGRSGVMRQPTHRRRRWASRWSPTRRASIWPRCLPRLLASPLRPRVLVVNSSSQDGTVELAAGDGRRDPDGDPARVQPRADARAGTPARWAPRSWRCSRPDAYPQHDDFLERLTEPVRSGRGRVAYGRQVAGRRQRPVRAGRARVQLPAGQPYPQRCRMGRGTAATAASARTPAPPGRTPRSTPSAASSRPWSPRRPSPSTELLARGGRIAYVAEATVEHAHRLDLAGAFRRQFDVGYSRRLYDWLLLEGEGDGRRGRRFAAEVLRRACRESPAELPRILCSSPRAGSATAPACTAIDCRWRWLAGSAARTISGRPRSWWPAAAPWCPSEPAMHLALLTNNRFPPREGIGRHIFEVARRLQARGHGSPCWHAAGHSRVGRETQGRWPAGSPLSALSAAAVPSGAGAHRARRLAARRRRRRRSAARPSAPAAAAAGPAAGGRDVPQPDARRHRAPSASPGCGPS